jgi:hypothetical protein
VEDKEIEEKKEEGEEEEVVRRRGGGKMLGFTIVVSTFHFVLQNSSPPNILRPTQMKILKDSREGNVYLNYLFVSLCLHFVTWDDLVSHFLFVSSY